MALPRRALLLLALAAATLAAVFAVNLTRGGAPANAAAATVKIDIKDYAYSKKTVTIKVGQKITWTNRDAMKHDVNSSKSGGPKGPLLAKGKSYSWTAKKAGTFSYHCTPHPYMKGKIIVKK
ncbi:MAG: cupredoxin family copper-binding protein [Patulibacter minatonensis]